MSTAGPPADVARSGQELPCESRGAVPAAAAHAATAGAQSGDSELLQWLPRYPLVGRAAHFNLVALAERLGVGVDSARQRVARLYNIQEWNTKHEELELSDDGDEGSQAGAPATVPSPRRGRAAKRGSCDFVLPSLDALPSIFDVSDADMPTVSPSPERAAGGGAAGASGARRVASSKRARERASGGASSPPADSKLDAAAHTPLPGTDASGRRVRRRGAVSPTEGGVISAHKPTPARNCGSARDASVVGAGGGTPGSSDGASGKASPDSVASGVKGGGHPDRTGTTPLFLRHEPPGQADGAAARRGTSGRRRRILGVPPRLQQAGTEEKVGKASPRASTRSPPMPVAAGGARSSTPH